MKTIGERLQGITHNDRNMTSCGIWSSSAKLSNYIATCGIFMCYVVLYLLLIIHNKKLQ